MTSFAFAKEEHKCDVALKKTIEKHSIKEAKDVKEAHKIFVKSIPCLGNEKYKKINISVLKLFVRVMKFHDFTEHFEVLYPYYHRYKDFFEKEILKDFSKSDQEIIKNAYSDFKDLAEGGNG